MAHWFNAALVGHPYFFAGAYSAFGYQSQPMGYPDLSRLGISNQHPDSGVEITHYLEKTLSRNRGD